MRLPLLIPLLFLPGCVAAGFDFETTEIIEPARDVTTIDPNTGKDITVHHEARTKTTRRRASYTDNRAAGAMAGNALQTLTDPTSLLQTIPGWGYLAGAATLLGGGRAVVKTATRASHLEGQNVGYTQSQLELGARVVPPPNAPLTGTPP